MLQLLESRIIFRNLPCQPNCQCAAMGGETKSDRMNFADLTKIAVDRIQKLEQINFRKIMGFILLNEPSETEMMQLAYGPETALISRIDEIKAMLRNLSPRNASFSQGSRSFSSPSAFHIPAEYWDQLPLGYADSTEEDCSIPNLAKFFNLDENYCYQDAALGGSIPLRSSGRSPSLPEFPIKPCHYYYKGYCKHGVNCRYFHGLLCFPDGHVQAFSPSFNELQSEDHGLSPGSLEQLELEITELLRARRGVPVSIASLPLLYYETYGKNLQADGYLTESQRHGKAGFSLTKLLARLKSSIRLIDRPHGQHSVILAECFPKFLEWRNERNEAGSTAMSSHQIYLTFPAESTFTEDDVSNYFKQFGPVKDVRIPCQDKRMFGFVSFVYPETVNEILLKRVPHYICGARVLVKPYREKSRIHTEKIKSAMHHPSYYVDWDSELQALPREFESSRGLKMHIEEQENLLELERTHLAEFNLEQKPLDQQSNFSHGVDNLKLQVSDEFPLEEHFSYTREALNVGSSTDDKTRNTGNGCTNLER